ncbi:MAG: asparagine synthase (glutamine-hydrolyzing) [Planctomycetota bacterium]|jgi:asparagine synthase (glutamine-hydrolysing)
MCGICAWIYNDVDRPVSEAMLRDAAMRMIHRGPDSEGIYAGSGIGLAMRRLAIIDLAHGDQPMWSDDRRYAIVYNGECYNFLELRKELISRGYNFTTNCDTEVVLKGYVEWGRDVLAKLNGMFGFAVYDKKDKSLFIARDRLGIKPLYYYTGDGFLSIASEIKCFFADTDIPREPDPQALNDYLTFKYVPAPRTGFKNISKLPAGHFAVYKDNNLKITKYWDLETEDLGIHNAEEACEAIESSLRDSVRYRLISDVPLGVMLSGGVDSSLTTALAKEEKASLDSFNIGFNSPDYDESPYAEMVSNHLDTNHHKKIINTFSFSDLGNLAKHLEEPLADSSALALMELCRLTRDNVTVALAGDGGDELGGGYPRYYWDAKSEKLKLIPGLSFLAKSAGQLFQKVGQLREFGRRCEKLGSTLSLPQEERYARWFSCFTVEDKKKLFTPEWQEKCIIGEESQCLKPFFQQAKRFDSAARLQYVDLKSFLADDLLLKADKISMAVSLELRVPFLDHNCVKTLMSLPSQYHISPRGELKTALKRTAASKVPESAVYRAKQGFSIPLEHWFKGSLDFMLNSFFSENTIERRGIFDPKEVNKLIKARKEGRTDVGHQLYSLMFLEAWFQAFFE